MNWLDFVIAGAGIVGLVIGWKVGLLGAIFNTVGVFVGMWLAANMSGQIAQWFTNQGFANTMASVLSYVAIVVGVFVGAQIARSVAKKMLSIVFLGWVDSLGSIAVGVLLGFGLAGALILGVARFSQDLPTTGGAGMIVQLSGIRGNLQDGLVKSQLVPVFIDVTDAIPGSAMGFVPGDYRQALDLLKERIEKET